MSDGIVFQVETSRILQILAKEIYDSPLALIRENVQNAYDAIRMRFFKEGVLEDGGHIEIVMDNQLIIISDNGIGMTETVLRDNFWKAGSSGKHGDAARLAGVVGTFGIGAMANFGVCTKLEVETKAENSDEVLISTAERENLKIGEESIVLNRSQVFREIGTTIRVTLDSKNLINQEQVLDYIKSYVSILPVPVYFNGKLISKCDPYTILPINNRQFLKIDKIKCSNSIYSGFFEVLTDSNGQVLVVVDQIALKGNVVDGRMILLQSGGQLMGFRSSFGLAPIPAASNYQFGGITDIVFLQPTAGREALSRDSIAQVNQLIALAEKSASEVVATTDTSDKNNAFLTWINIHKRYDLAGNITVKILPDGKDVKLNDIESYVNNSRVYYYAGSDRSIISQFANEETFVVHLSQTSLRRNIQLQYINAYLKLSPIPDKVQIIKIYSSDELGYQEASILLRSSAVLRDDYLIPDVQVAFADISHGVSVYPERNGESLKIYFSRASSLVPPLLELYNNARDLFPQFVKDFVRVNLYPKIQQYVPSSTRDGVEALRKALQRNRELYRYEEDDLGELEGMLGDYLSGEKDFSEVLSQTRNSKKLQTQKVSREQVGSIESIIPNLREANFIVQAKVAEKDEEVFSAMPPIIRDDINSDMKILLASEKYPLLNNFEMFLGLSDRLMRTEADFFHSPHTTRVLWGGHRVVYIFTEITGTLSLYYDIELRNAFNRERAGGKLFATTTLITKKRIFVPIPEDLVEEFSLNTGSKEFFVRFDVLASDIK